MNEPPGVDEPLVFDSFFRPQIWGGRRLAELLHKPLRAGAAIGEAWDLSAHPLHVSRVCEGPWAGTSLEELWRDHRRAVFGDGPSPPQFPWLIKWLDCHDWLSVQVHPNDAVAGQLLGESGGKTETWIVVHAEPTARIFAGLKPGVTRDDIVRSSLEGTVAECLHSFTPRPGDCVHIPAGTVHAMGGGLVLAEIQQTSDATFRLFDWNRVDAQGKSRDLHLDQALEAIDFQRGPVEPVPESSAAVQSLVECPYFRLERRSIAEPTDFRVDGMAAVLVLDGEVELALPGRSYRRQCVCGETVLLPTAIAALRGTPLRGPAKLLFVSLPNGRIV
jgi:mannose-6-phosphate isomerase